MNPIRFSRCVLPCLAAIALTTGVVQAQPHDTHQPKPNDAHATPVNADKAAKHVGDPYPFDTCPITGKKLGSMGDPLTTVYDGREVRFCCPSCPPKFEKDLAASFVKLDEKIIKDQVRMYPLTTSVMTGKELPASPAEPCGFVYGNRLVRLGAESEKADLQKDSKKYLGELDRAVIAKQGKDYPSQTCFVSNEKLGGDMGDPVDIVIAGRLIRLCCNSCKKDLEKEPAKFIAKIDESRKGKSTKPDTSAGHDGDDKKPNEHN